MDNTRRSFLKKAAITSAVAVSTTTAMAVAHSSKKSEANPDYDGVVIGKSNKKEILYNKSQAWAEYYKKAL